MNKCTLFRCTRACTLFIVSMNIYNWCTHICAQIFLKLLVVNYFLMSFSFKFHKDISFFWGVIALFEILYNVEVEKIEFFHLAPVAGFPYEGIFEKISLGISKQKNSRTDKNILNFFRGRLAFVSYLELLSEQSLLACKILILPASKTMW